MFGFIPFLDLSNPLTYLDLGLTLILVVTLLIYLKRFPIFRIVLGVSILWILAFVCSYFNLHITSFIFTNVGTIILVSLPLIFAPEIRHYLERVGRLSFLKVPDLVGSPEKGDLINVLAGSAFKLAETKTGATFVIQRRTGLGNIIDKGIKVDSVVNYEVLHSIFFPKSPLHDGAVIIVDGRIAAAKCLLPVDKGDELGLKFGTRHKSGVAITHETDAVSIIVSEQRGEVSLAENGTLEENLTLSQLTKKLSALL